MTTIRNVIPSTARILIVDDHDLDRDLMEVMLRGEGFDLAFAASGAEALTSVEIVPPDLILLDVVMPVMDGFEVARKLKSSDVTKNIPIIMVTAVDDHEGKLLGLIAGAEDFLSKPVSSAELRVRIRNLLRLKAYGDFHDRHSQLLETQVGERTEELVASERLYRSTFDHAPVGVAHVGLDGRLLRVNQRLCALLGYSAEQLMSPECAELLETEPAPGQVEAFARMTAGTLDRHVIEEKRYRRADGNNLFARIYVSVHRDADGRALHFISVIEDITERRVLEAQVRQTNRMEGIGRLASGIAHDFNNLLSVVLSYSELLAADLKEGDPMRADIDEIHAAGQRAVDLTQHLLAFSRKQVLQPEVVDLNKVVLSMDRMLRRILGADVELTAIRDHALNNILVDPGQMEQVIMNLVVNARDAMPNGGKLTIETADVVLDEAYALTHTGMHPGPHVVLEVSDTGTGMDDATQAHMFEPFYTTKDVGKGTGLGLATVFGIVKQSGGAISTRSAIGEGTTFKIYFPQTDRRVSARHSSAPPIRSLHGSETILLVEDEDRVRNLARTILNKYGYNVLEAPTAGDALLLGEQHTGAIDLLLTDVVMPRMDGRKLAERLASLRPTMKVLFMSGYTDDAVVREGLVKSNVALLQKPITPESLARNVRKALDAVVRA